MVTKIRGTGDALTPVVTGVDGDSGLFFPVADTVAIATGGLERLRVDTSGSVGVGVVPSAWGAPAKGVEFQAGAISSASALNLHITHNSYIGALGFNYVNSNTAARYTLGSSGHEWYIAPSGIAGNLVTFTQAMTLFQSGNLNIGGTRNAERLVVTNLAATSTAVLSNTIARIQSNGSAADANIQFADGVAFSANIGMQNGNLYFAPNGTERARFTSSGLFLIGSSVNNFGFLQEISGTSPTSLLGLSVFNTTPGVGARIGFLDGNSNRGIGNQANNFIFYSSAQGTGEHSRITGSGYFKASNSGTYGSVSGVGDLTNGTQHVIQNTVSGDTTLVVIASSPDNATNVRSFLPTGSNGNHYVGLVNAVAVFNVSSNGNVQNTNNSYTAISDEKLKENIVPASPKLPGLMEVEFVNFNFKEETGYETHKQFGVIAQQLETVFPGLVITTPDRDTEGNETGTVTKSVNYSVLALFACKALQEAKTEIDELKARIEQLESGV